MAERRDDDLTRLTPLTLGQPSVVLDTTLHAVFHTIIVFSLYLHFAGHNAPGGGFIAPCAGRR